MVQNLKQVPESMISQTIGPYRTQITRLPVPLQCRVTAGQAANATSALFGRSVSERHATGMIAAAVALGLYESRGNTRWSLSAAAGPGYGQSRHTR